MFRRLGRSWQARVAVSGHSMAPGLRAGDWLLVDPDAYRVSSPRPGDLVLAEKAEGLLVKRVGALPGDGVIELIGDAASTDDHRHDLAVPLSAISGRPWFRYWPPGRVGRLR
jgi:signal peptidase I